MKILFNIMSGDPVFKRRSKDLIEYTIPNIIKYNYSYNISLCKHSKLYTEYNTLNLSEKDDYNSNTEKGLKPFIYHYLNNTDFDFYVAIDDDTFINFKNLNFFLSNLSKTNLEMHGHVRKFSGISHVQGGPGIIMNKKTFDCLAELLSITEEFNEPKAYKFKYYDVILGDCVRLHNNYKKEKTILLVNNCTMITEFVKERVTKNFNEIDLNKIISLHVKDEAKMCDLATKLNIF